MMTKSMLSNIMRYSGYEIKLDPWTKAVTRELPAVEQPNTSVDEHIFEVVFGSSIFLQQGVPIRMDVAKKEIVHRLHTSLYGEIIVRLQQILRELHHSSREQIEDAVKDLLSSITED